MSAYLVAYHKQATSARMRFLVHAGGSVCGPDALPSPAQLVALDEGVPDTGDTGVVAHPAPLLAALTKSLDLEDGDLEIDGGPLGRVDVPGGAVSIYCARFTAMDPPFDTVAEKQAKFIELAQARGLDPVDLQLMRLVYERAVG